MNKFAFVSVFMLLGIGVPVLCLGGEGDAIPGMASQGIVRLPHSGMVEEAFGKTRRPGVRLHRKSYKTLPRIDAKSRETPSSERNLEAIEGRLVEKVGDMYLIATLTSDEPIRLLVDQDTIFITGPKSAGDLFKAQVTPNSNYVKIVW